MPPGIPENSAHPFKKHLVQLEEFTYESDLPSLIMEHIEDGSLDKQGKHKKYSSLETTIVYAQSIKALAHLHEKKIIHGYVKSSFALVMFISCSPSRKTDPKADLR